MELTLPKKMMSFREQWDLQSNRKQLKQGLDDMQLDSEDFLFRKAIPAIADNYPVSLIEGRDYLQKQAQKFLKRINANRNGANHFLMITEHGIWKREVRSALAHELIKDGQYVVSTAHATPHGFLNYGSVLTLDQCLVTHHLVNFKDPFIHLEKETPKVYQIEMLKKFQPVSENRLKNDSFSIWYFPHWHVIDPEFCFWFNGQECPESYYETQLAALSGLNMIATHPRVSEIVIKLRPDVKNAQKGKYINLTERILGEKKSAKFRFAFNLTTSQALPQISISVHDMFSGGFVESMWAGIPTLAVLPSEAEVPYRLPYREYWLKSGLFVRNSKELYESLLALIEGKVPENYNRMKESFLAACGWGSPTVGQALKSILNEIKN
jgi:hypothetical protein